MECDCDDLRAFRVHPKVVIIVVAFVVAFTIAMAITAARF